MRCKILTFLFLFLGSSGCFLGTIEAQEEQPFWRSKTRLYRQILEDRKIVVSVKKEEPSRGSGPSSGSQKVFRVVGAGLVHSPIKECFNDVQNFENLPKVSSHFRSARQDRRNQMVFLRIEALGYTARLMMSYRVSVDKKDEKQLDFQVTEGALKGLVGHYNFKSLGDQRTEVALWSFYKGERWPLPDFFLKFTLEVIAEKVAQKMRTYLERSYRKRSVSKVAGTAI